MTKKHKNLFNALQEQQRYAELEGLRRYLVEGSTMEVSHKKSLITIYTVYDVVTDHPMITGNASQIAEYLGYSKRTISRLANTCFDFYEKVVSLDVVDHVTQSDFESYYMMDEINPPESSNWKAILDLELKHKNPNTLKLDLR